MRNYHRSRGSGKGKESEYENGESDCPDDEEVPFHFIHDHPHSVLITNNDSCKKMIFQRNSMIHTGWQQDRIVEPLSGLRATGDGRI